MKTSITIASTAADMWTSNVLEQSIRDFEQLITEAAESRNNLVHGNVIALHSSIHNRFVRLMCDGCVDGRGGSKDVNKLPLNWGSERFLVVQRGESLFAFYSICHERYLWVSSQGIIRPGIKKALTDPIAESETFDIHTHEDTRTLDGDAKVSLFSASIDRFVRMHPDGAMDVAATKADAWEYFEVVLLMAEASSAAADDVLIAEDSDKDATSYQII
jgi:hypothetical protein